MTSIIGLLPFAVVILVAINKWSLKMSRWNLLWMAPLGYAAMILCAWIASNL